MADDEDIEPLVCDNGTGMVNVLVSRVWGVSYVLYILPLGPNSIQAYSSIILFLSNCNKGQELHLFTKVTSFTPQCNYTNLKLCLTLQAGFVGDDAPRVVCP